MNVDVKNSTKRTLPNNDSDNNNDNKKFKSKIIRDLFSCLYNKRSLYDSIRYISYKNNIDCEIQKNNYAKTFFNNSSNKKGINNIRTLKELTEFIKSEENISKNKCAFNINQACEIIKNFSEEIHKYNTTKYRYSEYSELPKIITNAFNYVCDNTKKIFIDKDQNKRLSILVCENFSLEKISDLIYRNYIKNCYNSKHSSICESFGNLLNHCDLHTRFYFLDSKYTLKLLSNVLQSQRRPDGCNMCCPSSTIIKFILKYYNDSYNFINTTGISILATTLILKYNGTYFKDKWGSFKNLNEDFKNKGVVYTKNDYDIISTKIASRDHSIIQHLKSIRNEINNTGFYEIRKIDYLKNLIICCINKNNISKNNLPFLLFKKKESKTKVVSEKKNK